MDHVWGYATDRRLREKNEDSYGVFELPRCTLAMVCDGMGGHAGGAEASAIAVRVIHDTILELEDLPIAQALTEAIQAANQSIYEISRKVRRLLGMGTTVACIAVSGNQAWIAHVGDSRVYLVRGRTAKLLTRDHTMVNLFVDAELLSPEDAHSHPEAHILARSVGVDRHVEVDVQGPIDLRPGDILVACSDGVHGAVEEEEFGDVDWTSPQRGVDQLLKLVRGRDSDDNATAVAVAVGTSTLDRPPASHLPSPEVLNAVAPTTTGGTEMAGLATPVPQAPRPAIRMPSMGGGAFVLEEAPPPPPPPPSQGSPLVQFDDAPPPAAPPPPERAGAPPPGRRKAPPGRRRQTAILVVAGVIACAVVVAAVVVGSADHATTADEASPDGVATVSLLNAAEEDPSATPLDLPDLSAPPDQDTEAPEDMALPHQWRFAPVMPIRSRRTPHRASRYVQPPPGGPLQLEAVLAARNRECVKALDAVRAAMRESMDYATLYTQAWTCFNDNHQGYLARADARTVADFSALLVHFEGHAPTDRAQLRLPAWYRPARGGIEYRLDAFIESGDVDLFADVMMDRLGGPALAEHLVRDVSLEAQAAVALSRIAEPTPEVEQWWARRVYYAALAMEELPGELISEYRPELRDEIVAQLDAATGGRYSRADAEAEGVPPVVITAVDTARGRIEPPEGRQVAVGPAPVASARPSPETPPGPLPAPADTDPDTTEPVDLRPIIHRGGEDPLPEGLR